jgi:single-strand DNA-binding protein
MPTETTNRLSREQLLALRGLRLPSAAIKQLQQAGIYCEPSISTEHQHLARFKFRRFDMAKSINKVILVGNVGKDPEVKYTPSGVALAKFSLATNERFKDKSGEWQDRTEWHNVLAWQRLAEIVGEFVHQGAKLYIEGKLQTSNWEDRNSGEKKFRSEIVARDIVLLGSRETNGDGDRDSAEEERELVPAGTGEILDDIPF